MNKNIRKLSHHINHKIFKKKKNNVKEHGMSSMDTLNTVIRFNRTKLIINKETRVINNLIET